MHFDRNDAERIFGKAATADAAARDKLTQDEVEDAAEGVGIPREAVRAAIDREAEAAKRSDKRRKRLARAVRRVVVFAIVIAALAGGIFGFAVLVTDGELTESYNRVLAARGAVEVVRDNIATVDISLATTINDGERAVVIERAHRRVYVAKLDYDVRVRDYNETASSFLGRFTRSHGVSQLPAEMPYATRVWRTP